MAASPPSIPDLGVGFVERILIIDDNRDIHNDIKRILGGNQPSDDSHLDLERDLFGDDEEEETSPSTTYEFASAFQGQEAIELVAQEFAQNRRFSAVFLDVRMPPGINGVETAAKLWQIDKDLEIVLCTAFSDSSWEDTQKTLGLTDQLLILKKPFDAVEVRQLALALSRKWALRQQSHNFVEQLELLVKARTSELEAAIESRQTVEMELRQAQKLEAVGQLAAGIAHEINTPIQFVGDSVHFIRECFADLGNLAQSYSGMKESLEAIKDARHLVTQMKDVEEQADLSFIQDNLEPAFERVIEGIDRVASIVRAMKDFGRPDDRDKTPADINRAIQSTLIVAANEYKYVADIRTELGELRPLECYLGEINQVILNLIVNAAHAIAEKNKDSDQRGLIAVRTLEKDNCAVIEIQDDGSGIPEKIRERVFDPFFTTKEIGRGTGQGLAIARSIIMDKHGGNISLSSREGEGTTFTIVLPYEVDEKKRAA